MKRHLLIATSIIVAITSCNKEETKVDTPIVHEETVWVEFTTGATTKAALQEGYGTHKIVWEENDAISINGETFTVTELSEDNLKATFGANVPVSFTDATEYKAVYPASAGTTFDAISISATPAVIVGGFDDIVAVAYSTDMSLEFRHVTSLIKFQIPSDFSVNEVTISTNEALAGDINVRMSAEDATPEIEISEGKSEITLKGTFTSGDNYYVAVLPGAKTNLTVRFNGYLAKSWDKVVEIGQGRVANMGTLPAPEKSSWVVKGIDGWTNEAIMYKEGNWVVARNVKSTTNTFKFYSNGGTWVGAKNSDTHGNYAYPQGDGDGADINVSNTNTLYDFYYCAEGGMYMILPAGTSIDAIEVKTDMYLRGACNTWGATTPTMHDGKYYGWKNLTFDSAPEFKFSTKTDAWEWQYSTETTLNINQWTELKAGSEGWNNTKYSVAGTYDIYTTSDKLARDKVVIVKAGDPIPAL